MATAQLRMSALLTPVGVVFMCAFPSWLVVRLGVEVVGFVLWVLIA